MAPLSEAAAAVPQKPHETLMKAFEGSSSKLELSFEVCNNTEIFLLTGTVI